MKQAWRTLIESQLLDNRDQARVITSMVATETNGSREWLNPRLRGRIGLVASDWVR